MNNETLSLNKKAQDPIRKLFGQDVMIQTRTPSQITGVLKGCNKGWFELENVYVRRFLQDGHLQNCYSFYHILVDRNAVTFIGEIEPQRS